MNLRSRFSLTKINPLEMAGLCKMLHMFAASMDMFQMCSLILQNRSFPFIVAIFLNKILLDIRTFSGLI